MAVVSKGAGVFIALHSSCSPCTVPVSGLAVTRHAHQNENTTRGNKGNKADGEGALSDVSSLSLSGNDDASAVSDGLLDGSMVLSAPIPTLEGDSGTAAAARLADAQRVVEEVEACWLLRARLNQIPTHSHSREQTSPL
jgi:hypothetical protein